MKFPGAHRFRLRVALCFIAIWCALVSTAQAQHFDIDGPRKKVTLPFKFERNSVIIPVTINGNGPYNFILDSGVGLMLITEPKLVDSLNISYKRLVTIPGLGEGDDAQAYITGQLDVSVPGVKGYGISAAILKTDNLNLSGFVGMPIHGIIGYEFFNNLIVQVNFADTVLNIYRPKDITRIKRKGTKVPLLVEEKKPYLISKVTLPDGSSSMNKLLIDLGAGHALSLDYLLQKKGMPDKFIAGNLGMGLNGPITGFISRAKLLDLGGYHVVAPLTAFPDANNTNIKPSVPRDGNVGMEILKRFKVTFDYTGGAVYLKKGYGFKEPFEHDMTGIEYYASGPGLEHIIISRVEPGSSGYDVGLERGDEIVAINFKPVYKMSLEEIDNLFKSRHERTMLLEIYHSGKTDHVVLTLKRRI
ncbi:aspartyl protease family protein [Mucilaginibacter sp. JRF]|uniref:PDZ domain-containing protein n=1 Tax=Mucilaginibacter sp. JRF TaxID=2780088 RepID=UPI0018827BA6|nr:PDZ domain-containing protein [Mucilaginibacter sp. JRF]MBE9585615.1 aspartyl protease family protein [Mucilaginibacter sp. JRF]